jgi:hypothetical protein
MRAPTIGASGAFRGLPLIGIRTSIRAPHRPAQSWSLSISEAHIAERYERDGWLARPLRNHLMPPVFWPRLWPSPPSDGLLRLMNEATIIVIFRPAPQDGRVNRHGWRGIGSAAACASIARPWNGRSAPGTRWPLTVWLFVTPDASLDHPAGVRSYDQSDPTGTSGDLGSA